MGSAAALSALGPAPTTDAAMLVAPRTNSKTYMHRMDVVRATALQIKGRVYDWTFNVFEVARASGGRPLSTVTLALLDSQGLLDGWLLDRPTVERYLSAVEDGYNANPYHNAIHAADVAQTSAVIMVKLDEHLRRCAARRREAAARQQLERASLGGGEGGGGGGGASAAPSAAEAEAAAGLSKLERFCIILASAVHDLGHPGVNNDFLIRARDRHAILYNDKSVNENMHCARAFEVALGREGCDLFERFSDEEYAKARGMMIPMILSTDMAVHFDLLAKFASAAEAVPDPSAWDAPGRTLLFQMVVHLADLANPARPFPLACAWAERVVTEFMAQGDAEAGRGMAVTPFCDRSKVSMPAAQLGFLLTFARPTLEAFAFAAPGFVAMVAPELEETRLKWEFLKEAGVKHPQLNGEYPPWTPELAAAIAEGRAAASAAAAEREAKADAAARAWDEAELRREQEERERHAHAHPHHAHGHHQHHHKQQQPEQQQQQPHAQQQHQQPQRAGGS